MLPSLAVIGSKAELRQVELNGLLTLPSLAVIGSK